MEQKNDRSVQFVILPKKNSQNILTKNFWTSKLNKTVEIGIVFDGKDDSDLLLHKYIRFSDQESTKNFTNITIIRRSRFESFYNFM